MRNVLNDDALSPYPNVTKYLNTLGPYTEEVQNWIKHAPEYDPALAAKNPKGPPNPGQYSDSSTDYDSYDTTEPTGPDVIEPVSIGGKGTSPQQVFCASDACKII